MIGKPTASDIGPGNTMLVRPSTAPVSAGEIGQMLMYEELARARIRELLAAARVHRIRRRA